MITKDSNRIMYSVDELAALIGVSRGVIYKLVKKNEIPYTKIGERILFRRDSIEKWLNEIEVA